MHLVQNQNLVFHLSFELLSELLKLSYHTEEKIANKCLENTFDLHIDKHMFLLYIGNRTVVREHAFWYIGELKRLQKKREEFIMRSEKRKDMYADRYHAGAKGQKHCHYAKHRKTNSIRRFVTGIAALVMVMSLSFGFGSFFSSAHDSKAEEPSGERYYKSVQLEKGDSLWSIAQRYRRTEDSIYEYMDELAEANHLSLKDRNNLQEGDYLVVSYYGDDSVY